MSGEAHLLRMLEPAVRPMGAPSPGVQPRGPIDGLSFDQVLQQAEASQPIRLSAHAQQRLDEMGVQLGESELRAIGEAVDRAAEKGAREALVLMDRLALVVNVPNRTMVTAMSEQRMREGVVTKIDAAVWAEHAPAATEEHRLRL